MTAADIDKDFVAAERMVLDKLKKLKAKDDQIEEVKKIAAYIQAIKIKHREQVGAIFADFSGLDKAVAGQVTLHCKEADSIMLSFGKTAQESLKSLLAELKKTKQEAYSRVLKVGGNVTTQRDLAEGTGKLLGRTVSSSVDVKSYLNTVKGVQTDADQQIELLEKVIGIFKK